jgi:hypothetical protein
MNPIYYCSLFIEGPFSDRAWARNYFWPDSIGADRQVCYLQNVGDKPTLMYSFRISHVPDLCILSSQRPRLKFVLLHESFGSTASRGFAVYEGGNDSLLGNYCARERKCVLHAG